MLLKGLIGGLITAVAAAQQPPGPIAPTNISAASPEPLLQPVEGADAASASSLPSTTAAANGAPAHADLLKCTSVAPSSAPVFITTDGISFMSGNSTFHVVGGNQYRLMLSNASRTQQIFDTAQQLGLNVLRTWAFGEGGPPGQSLQPAPGVYDEATFRALDNVVAEAARRNTKLLLVLCNQWSDFGGAPQYVAWAAAAGEQGATSVDAFYTSPFMRRLYKTFVATLLNRTNTVTGVRFKDEPAIFGFDLINEPRHSDPAVLHDWLSEMSEFVKSIDPNHMLATGQEGYFGNSTRELLPFNPNGDSAGGDFKRNNALPAISFCSLHSWADQWLGCCSGHCLLPFVHNWLASHEQVAREIGKPLLLSEYGARRHCVSAAPPPQSRPLPSPPPPAGAPPLGQSMASNSSGGVQARWPDHGPMLTRDGLYRAVLNRSLASAEQGSALAGTLFWMLGVGGENDTDAYTMYGSGEQAARDEVTSELIRRHAQAIRALDRNSTAGR